MSAYADLTAQHAHEGRRTGMGCAAASGRIALRDMKPWADEAQVVTFARGCLADSIARWGRA